MSHDTDSLVYKILQMSYMVHLGQLAIGTDIPFYFRVHGVAQVMTRFKVAPDVMLAVYLYNMMTKGAIDRDVIVRHFPDRLVKLADVYTDRFNEYDTETYRAVCTLTLAEFIEDTLFGVYIGKHLVSEGVRLLKAKLKDLQVPKDLLAIAMELADTLSVDPREELSVENTEAKTAQDTKDQ